MFGLGTVLIIVFFIFELKKFNYIIMQYAKVAVGTVHKTVPIMLFKSFKNNIKCQNTFHMN